MSEILQCCIVLCAVVHIPKTAFHWTQQWYSTCSGRFNFLKKKWWRTRQSSPSPRTVWVGPGNHVLERVHIGVTRRIRLNRPCAAGMRPYVRLVWPFVKFHEFSPRWSPALSVNLPLSTWHLCTDMRALLNGSPRTTKSYERWLKKMWQTSHTTYSKTVKPFFDWTLIFTKHRGATIGPHLFQWATTVKQYSLLVPSTQNIHCESKKQGTTILSITSPNVDRFSNFFHWQIH